MNTLLSEWLEAKAKLTHYKELEMKLRLEVIDEFFDDEDQNSGKTQNATSGNCIVKAGFKFNYSFDQDQLDIFTHQMSQAEQECIKWKPELSISAYKNLENSDNIDECLIVKPATPSLTVKEVE